MTLTLLELRALGKIVKTRNKDGWSFHGSENLAKDLNLQQTLARELLSKLISDKVLEKGDPNTHPTIIPVKITMQGHELRVRAFKEMFPDIGAMLK